MEHTDNALLRGIQISLEAHLREIEELLGPRYELALYARNTDRTISADMLLTRIDTDKLVPDLAKFIALAEGEG